MTAMTCRELGGECDQRLSASSWDEMVTVMTKHVMDKHPDVAKQMEKIHKEDPKKWGREMKAHRHGGEQGTHDRKSHLDSPRTALQQSIRPRLACFIPPFHRTQGRNYPTTLEQPLSGLHVWSRSYDREFEDLFKLQDEIAADVLAVHTGSIGTVSRTTFIQAPPTCDLEAYQLYLQGRSLATRPSHGNLRAARELLRSAIDRDPGFARAYVAMAITAGYEFLFGEGTAINLAEVEQNALRALELDPNLAEAHAVLGGVNADRGNWLGADERFHSAFALNSADAITHYQFAVTVATQVGHLRRASESIREACRLAPAEPIFGLSRQACARSRAPIERPWRT